MLILYTGDSCPFCRQVEAYLQSKGLAYEARDIRANPDYADELVEIGGKQQIPYLVDTERGVSMYESEDIIQYVEDTYGENPVIQM
jgi:glutathione S-transferase